MRVKIKYGSQIVVRDLPDHTTVGDIIEDDSIRAALGYGDNVNAVHNGTVLSEECLAPEFLDDGSIGNPSRGALVMETRCNKKELEQIVDAICG
jgi:hypothetical protein